MRYFRKAVGVSQASVYLIFSPRVVPESERLLDISKPPLTLLDAAFSTLVGLFPRSRDYDVVYLAVAFHVSHRR